MGQKYKGVNNWRPLIVKYIGHKIREWVEARLFPRCSTVGAPRQASRKLGSVGRRPSSAARQLVRRQAKAISPLCGRTPLVSQSKRRTCAPPTRTVSRRLVLRNCFNIIKLSIFKLSFLFHNKSQKKSLK